MVENRQGCGACLRPIPRLGSRHHPAKAIGFALGWFGSPIDGPTQSPVKGHNRLATELQGLSFQHCNRIPHQAGWCQMVPVLL